MNKSWLILLSLGLLLQLANSGCGDVDSGADGDSDTDTDTDSDTDTDTDTDSDTDTDTDTDSDTDTDTDTGQDWDPQGTVENGDFCWRDENCVSGYCETSRTSPVDEDGRCEDPLPDGRIRGVGNVRNFKTNEFLGEVDFDVVGAMDVVLNPTGAVAVATVTTDADGYFEVDLDTSANEKLVGLVSRVDLEGYYLTFTGLVEPNSETGIYEPGFINHDLWAVPQEIIDDWSAILLADEVYQAYAPLGENGGVVGKVRDMDTGEGVEGITVKSQLPEDDTRAIVLYLSEDETSVSTESTSSNGLFIILDPEIAEKFDAYRGDVKENIVELTTGQTFGAIMTTAIQVDYDGQ